jgi:hypothetical protein
MKTRPFALVISLGLCSVFGGAPAARAQFTSIDNFAATQGPLVIVGPNPTNPVYSALSPAPGVIGNARGMTLTRTSSNFGFVQADVNLSMANTLSFFSSPATTGSLLVKYDGGTSQALNPTGLGHRSLQGFLVGQVASDLGGQLVFTFYTDATHFSQAVIPVGGDPSQTDFNIFVATANIGIGPGAAGPADFSNIGAVTLLVNSTSGAGNIFIQDLAIVVPEPGTLALFGLCLVGLTGVGLYRRRAQLAGAKGKLAG